MMAVQELHMTREGMDTESIYLQCKSIGVEPVVTSASHQLCGNPSRAVRFFTPTATLCRIGLPWMKYLRVQYHGRCGRACGRFLLMLPHFCAVKLILKLWNWFQTSCRVARAAARMASHENTARMAPSSFGNGTEQRSMP